jgi:hypothetical protein
MLHLVFLFAAASAVPASPSGPTLYRVDLAGGQSSWAMGKPQPNGALLLFRHYPDGALMSVRIKDVKQVVSGAQKTEGKQIHPGDTIEVGATGGGGGAGAATASVPAKKPYLGERPDGTALLDPNRPYNPAWDSTRVPGLSMAYPNSPNDYVEGKTIAFPPAQAVQAAPGDVPKMPE